MFGKADHTWAVEPPLRPHIVEGFLQSSCPLPNFASIFRQALEPVPVALPTATTSLTPGFFPLSSTVVLCSPKEKVLYVRHMPGTDGDLLTEETGLRSDGSRIPSHKRDALLSKAPFRFSGGQAKMSVCEHTLCHGGDACENETDACRSLRIRPGRK